MANGRCRTICWTPLWNKDREGGDWSICSWQSAWRRKEGQTLFY